MKTKIQPKAILLGHVIKADANGEYPKEIEIAKPGSWRTPWHGNFDLTVADFHEAVDHFNAGVYRVQGTEPLPGTLDHMGGTSPAAFRIPSVYVREDGTFMASVTWTALGTEKLDRDEYRYVSFEYYTRQQPYVDPENEDNVMSNVLTGATLTNDPLFKKLKPVMASARSGDNEEGESMDLKTIRAKKLEDLSDEEKAFLEEHKSELTDDERTAFGITVEETEEERTAREAEEKRVADEKKAAEDAAAEKERKEGEQLAATAKGLGLTVKDLKQLQADAKAGREAQQELLKDRLTASVKGHVARGAVKSDQIDAAVEILMASSDAHRTKFENFLTALPSNELLASAEKGSGVDEEQPVALTDEDRSMATAFGNTPEEIEAYKKEQAAKA